MIAYSFDFKLRKHPNMAVIPLNTTYHPSQPPARFTVSEIAQGMQRKANLGEKAELTYVSMSIPS